MLLVLRGVANHDEREHLAAHAEMPNELVDALRNPALFNALHALDERQKLGRAAQDEAAVLVSKERLMRFTRQDGDGLGECGRAQQEEEPHREEREAHARRVTRARYFDARL